MGLPAFDFVPFSSMIRVISSKLACQSSIFGLQNYKICAYWMKIINLKAHFGASSVFNQPIFVSKSFLQDKTPNIQNSVS